MKVKSSVLSSSLSVVSYEVCCVYVPVFVTYLGPFLVIQTYLVNTCSLYGDQRMVLILGETPFLGWGLDLGLGVRVGLLK